VLRTEFSYGATLKEIAERHGIEVDTVKRRCSREKWMLLRPETHSKGIVPALSPAIFTEKVQAAATVGMNLAERANAHAARVFEIVSKKVENANLPEPKNWRDMQIATSIARQAGGLDRPDAMAAVQVNLWGGDGGNPVDLVSEVVQEVSDFDTLPEGTATD